MSEGGGGFGGGGAGARGFVGDSGRRRVDTRGCAAECAPAVHGCFAAGVCVWVFDCDPCAFVCLGVSVTVDVALSQGVYLACCCCCPCGALPLRAVSQGLGATGERCKYEGVSRHSSPPRARPPHKDK